MKSAEKEEALEWLYSNGDLCDVCMYAGDCSPGVHCGPNGPIYPYCADHEPDRYVNEDELEELWQEHLEELWQEHLEELEHEQLKELEHEQLEELKREYFKELIGGNES